MLKVLAVNLFLLAVAVTYYGNKRKRCTFHKYRIGTKITKNTNLVMMFGYACGMYFMEKTTPLLMAEDDDDEHHA
jgi:hypothetical protein